MAHYLTVLKNGQVQQKIELNEEAVVIGRSKDVALSIHDTSLLVSREHAQVVRRSGRYHVRNLEGRNGTRVNGNDASDWTPLDQGDAIHVGPFLIIYSYGYVWDPNGPTLYSGPTHPIDRQRNAMAETMRITESNTAPKACIEFSDGREQHIYQRSFTVGCKRENTVWLHDKTVGDSSAEIWAENGSWFIRNTDPEHPVTVGKQQVEGSVALAPGQQIAVGCSSFRFSLHKD